MGGEQAMCGCVEDMNVVARADCTEAVGRSNYTAYQDSETGLLVVDINPDAFHIEFRACEGYDYQDEITPEEFAEVDYKDPTVNDGDNEREAACKAAFEERFPGQEWALKEPKKPRRMLNYKQSFGDL